MAEICTSRLLLYRSFPPTPSGDVLHALRPIILWLHVERQKHVTDTNKLKTSYVCHLRKSQKLLTERALSELHGIQNIQSYSDFNGGLCKRRTGYNLTVKITPFLIKWCKFLHEVLSTQKTIYAILGGCKSQPFLIWSSWSVTKYTWGGGAWSLWHMEPHTHFMMQYTSEPFGIKLLP